ncbi:MAG: hypothetical protein P9M08_06325 [Candidatus Erginobacter occultus]|nr:hypothetical protein [Candidatus Erginobacter occultus]
MKRTLIGLMLLVLGAGPLFGVAETELPVTRVVYFISGVGYFEHRGTIAGETEVRLRFSADQMNDILKSLVVLDSGGGEIATAGYPSREPLERALKNFGVDISDDPTPGELLGRLRGTEIVIEAPEKMEGKILTVETRSEQVVPTRTLIEKEYLSLLTPEGIRTVGLEAISSLALADGKLNAELNRALTLLAENRDTDRKPFSIYFRGKGERAVRVGYITETPVWKASYRLVLDGREEKTALLQGWAIVENTGDLDWEDVELSLVSGRPISFIQDLYTPLYLSRPVVEPELYSSLTPRRYDEGIAEEMEAAPAAPMLMMKSAQRSRAMGRGDAGFALAEEAAPEELRDSMADLHTGAAGAEVGELFSYRVERPVSLSRGESALLPIINGPIAAEKVSIYNASVLARNPLNGVFLKNDTGSTLSAGPVTVYDDSSYGGDGQIGNLSPGAERLLSYAIDLKLTVDSSREQSRTIDTAKISRGNLEIARKTRYQQIYRVKNSSDRERTLIVEHPRRRNLELVEPAKPLEETEDLYRFRVAADGDVITAFTVREEETTRQTLVILPLNVGELIRYSENGEIPRKVRDALAEAARRKNLLTQAERELKSRERQRATLRKEQEHTRKNMEAVAAGSPAYNRFEKKLLELETRIENLQGEIARQEELVERLMKELADYIGSLDIG